ncbi:ABC transporter permease [Neobacillus sp. D3-1R]|uniref:ABC transporter permease n=1 Tax=Neobacillus sp. D3-1R TaxID=3445778 RepID=UPI003F9F75D1
MNKFWIILFHTYTSKIKTKSFIITTIISVAILLGLTNMNRILENFNKDSDKKVIIIDETEQLQTALMDQIKVMDKELQLESFSGSTEEAEKLIKDGSYNGLLTLSFNKESLPEATYKTKSLAETEISRELETALQQIKTALTASKINLTMEQLAKLNEPVHFEKKALEKDAKTEEELNQARGLVYVLLFIIYFSVIMYANMIAMEVATEKSSRVMEILISSVSPVKQMFAKILGIGLLSLTQLAIQLSVGYISVKRNLSTMDGGFFEFFGFNSLPNMTIVFAVVFFVLGYFLYATLAAFLGSLVSRIEDVQQMITPMTLLVVAGFMLAVFGLGNPEASYVRITSFIPFFTPMIMFLRVGMLNIPFWEISLSILILVGTIVFLGIFGAKVYRGGVLMYGKSNSIKDIKKAIQLGKNE